MLISEVILKSKDALYISANFMQGEPNPFLSPLHHHNQMNVYGINALIYVV